MSVRETASLTLERLARRGDKPLSIGIERPVRILPPPETSPWPRVSFDILVSTVLVLLTIICLAAVLCLDRPAPIAIAALPAEEPITVAKPQPLKVEPVDEAMLGMIAPALQPAGAGTADPLPGGIHLVIGKDPAIAEVKTATLKDMEKLAKEDPADPHPLMQLGAAYTEKGEFEKAAVAYAKAYDLDPASVHSAFNLAVTLDHLGKTRQAAYYYGKTMEAVGFNPATMENSDVPVETVRARLAFLTR